MSTTATYDADTVAINESDLVAVAAGDITIPAGRVEAAASLALADRAPAPISEVTTS